MRQTVIDYGNLRLWNVQTNSINQEQVFDSSGTDITHSRITVSVTGHIREGAATAGIRSSLVNYGGSPASVPTPSAQNTSLTEVDHDWREIVSQKQPFRMWIGCDDAGAGGSLHLHVTPYTDASQGGVQAANRYGTGIEWFDCNAGPKCLSFNVESNFSAHAMRVSMVFELCVPWCEASDTTAKILVNRWSVSDSIDDNLITTRTYNGTLKVANPYINPNLLRAVCLPPLAEGMRRYSMDFNVGDDGRSMSYRIVDKEAVFSCPKPARTWNITHSESFGLGRPLGSLSLNITLTSDRDTSKKDLIKLANRIAEEKITGLSLANVGEKSPLILIDDMTVVDYTSNDGPVRVDFRLQARRLRDDGGAFDGAAGDLGKNLVGTNFPAYTGGADVYDANVSIDPGVQGKVPFAGAVVTYLRNICYQSPYNYIRNGVVPDPDDSAEVSTGPSGMPEVTARTVSAGSITVPSWVSTQFKTAIYTSYQVDAVWETSDNRVMLPLAQSSASYTNGDTIAVCRMGNSFTKRIIRIEASRLGSPPQLQTPQDYWETGSGASRMKYTRLKTKLAPTVPQKSSDGQDMWVVRAEYTYACSRPPKLDEDLPIGIDPTYTGTKRSLASASLNTINEGSTIS